MSQKLRKALTGTSSATEQQALSVLPTTVKNSLSVANTQRKIRGVITVQKLIHNRFNEPYRIIDVNNKALSLEDIPDNLVGVIHKLEDYEATGYNPDFIDTIPHILMDMAELLENPTAENIKACLHKINYILNAKENAVSE